MTDSPVTARPHHDLSIDQKLALKTAAARLQAEFDGTFGVDTIERFLNSSYDQFAGRATIPNFLPLLAERFARQLQFVTCGEDGDLRLCDDLDRRMVHGGCQRDRAGIEKATGGKACATFFEIHSGQADVLSLGCCDGHADAPVLELFGVFLDDDRVGAFRQRSAGEDADGLTGANGAIETMACGGFADLFEFCARFCDVGAAHGIAVHGGGGERRLGAQGDEIAGENASAGFGERKGFGARNGAGVAGDAGKGFLDGHQGHGRNSFQIDWVRGSVRRSSRRTCRRISPERGCRRSPCRDRPPWPCRRW